MRRSLYMKSSEVSFKTRSTSTWLSFKGKATKLTTLKWFILVVHCIQFSKLSFSYYFIRALMSHQIQFFCLPWKAAFLKWISQQVLFFLLKYKVKLNLYTISQFPATIYNMSSLFCSFSKHELRRKRGEFESILLRMQEMFETFISVTFD